MPKRPVNAFTVPVPCPMCGVTVPTPFVLAAIPYGDDFTYRGGVPAGFTIQQEWDTSGLKAHVTSAHGGVIDPLA